ncbi:hypothetical protein CCL09_00845 [Pseudomonas congelans]|nr:hypothetical protein CCL09_00845 [Pseudomonas congelans]
MWQSLQYSAQPCINVPHNTDPARAADPYADNDIAVDGSLWPSATDIFAAGGCCSLPWPVRQPARTPGGWRAAQHHAQAMLGDTSAFAATPWFWSDQYNLQAQLAGIVSFSDEVVVRDLGASLLFHLNECDKLVGASLSRSSPW